MSEFWKLDQFLLSEGIEVVDKKRDAKINIYPYEQLKLIVGVHKKLKKREDIYSLRLHSEIGKEIEEHKVSNKRLERYLREINKKETKDELEEFIEKTGVEVINRAKKSIDKVYESNYIDLIKRSMASNEICIGKCYDNNIWIDEGYKIKDISKFCFNLLEMDCVYYLGKVKRMGYNFDFKNLINYYLTLEGLNNDSYAFIEALISYPVDYIKTFEKFLFMKESNFKKDEIIDKLRLAIKRDGEDLMLK
ncbi:hypothetical protein SAMN02745163_04200 [Clostridium cavendishii DSM 21758]|uniref:Spore coat protein, CotS family n=1 Tax=Clostridium cavendishii DSM 21758 TaxID=1121302 RepID=A0A1M6U7E7_9CLOT|nr:hypothetical protein [Clostridium cavendishii]SHK65090.1 hypothetical protein SAMN02745163_04200 [Clostridium cavendishii DSM 21758]